MASQIEEAVELQAQAPSATPTGFDVYQKIAAVAGELAKAGIGKNRKNEQQGFKFRGIDDVYNSLSSVMARNGLVVLPRMTNRTVTERVTAKGGVLFYVIVDAEFDFVAASDGSKHTVRTFGEAMDSGDKATNKAMSAAYKYAAFQAFCIPTEGDNDADATTHPPIVQPPPVGYEDWLADLGTVAQEQGTAALKKAWTSSSEDYRKHLTTTDPKAWEAMKTVAAKVKTTEAA